MHVLINTRKLVTGQDRHDVCNLGTNVSKDIASFSPRDTKVSGIKRKVMYRLIRSAKLDDATAWAGKASVLRYRILIL
jgi:hypothetical protein